MPLAARSAATRTAAARKKPAVSKATTAADEAQAVDLRAPSLVTAKDNTETAIPPAPLTAPSGAGKLINIPSDVSLVGLGGTRLPQEHHHAAMLESMDRKARELCDDTRRQYELLVARMEAQHERQLQSLQHKLKEVVSTSLPLSDHRQVVRDLARTHERETRALVQAHDDDAAAMRVRYKQIANDQLLLRGRAFQDEKDQLLETMTQLEMDRNAALRQWRAEELVVLSGQKELHETRQAHALTQQKLQEACQHIVSLKAQLAKLDRLSKKRKDERIAHAEAQTKSQQQLAAAHDTVNELGRHVAVLETEWNHARGACATQLDELTGLKSALASRETQANELQRALAECTAKETLLREFRDSERAMYEQQRLAWCDAQAKLERHEADARQQVAALQQEKKTLEAQYERVAQEAARITSDRDTREAALREKLHSVRLTYAAAAKRVSQLEAIHAEQQDEERVHKLLFASPNASRRG